MGVPHPNGGNGKWQFGVRLCVLMKGNKGRKSGHSSQQVSPDTKAESRVRTEQVGKPAAILALWVKVLSFPRHLQPLLLPSFHPSACLSIHPAAQPSPSKEDSFPVPKGLSGSNKAKTSGCCQPLSQMMPEPSLCPGCCGTEGWESPTKKGN